MIRPQIRNVCYQTSHSGYPVMTKEFGIDIEDEYFIDILKRLAVYKTTAQHPQDFFAPMFKWSIEIMYF